MKGKMFEISDKKARAHCAFLLSELAMKEVDPKNIKNNFHDVTDDDKEKAIYNLELTFSACALARGLIDEKLLAQCASLLNWNIQTAPEHQAQQPGKASKEQFIKGLELLKAAKPFRKRMHVTNLAGITKYDSEAILLLEEEISEIASHLALAILAFHVFLFKTNIADLLPEETFHILLEDLQIMQLSLTAIKWNNCPKMGFIFLVIGLEHLKSTLVNIVPNMPMVKDPELELINSISFVLDRATQLLRIPSA